MRATIKPFQQGQLDGLCGVYAVLNAIRLVLASHGKRLGRHDWAELFFHLVSKMDRSSGGICKVIEHGMSHKALRKTARCALEYMNKHHLQEISFGRVFKKGADPTFQDVVEAIGSHTRFRQPAIVDFSERLDHWSVIRDVTETSFLLCDSAGHHRIPISRCRLMAIDEPEAAMHLMNINGIFVVGLCS